jgi:hypothetical protein
MTLSLLNKFLTLHRFRAVEWDGRELIAYRKNSSGLEPMCSAEFPSHSKVRKEMEHLERRVKRHKQFYYEVEPMSNIRLVDGR